MNFLGGAPSSLTVTGCVCHPEANGEYLLARDTIGGKAHWTRQVAGRTFHLYSISVPHDAWVIGTDMHSHILWIESYEGEPSWLTHMWKEECAANGQSQQVCTIPCAIHM